jgi:Fur family zinc uptake transcriptional regulator
MIPQAVQAYCVTNAVDLTPIRQVLLEHLWQSRVPTKAYDMIEVLREKGIGSPKPPTVYRTIDFLESQGLVHKVHALNAYLPCLHPGAHHTCQFLICETCGMTQEFCDHELASRIPKRAEAFGFRPRASFVEVFGTCQQCLNL